MYVCMCVCTYVCMYVCVCMYVYIYVLCITYVCIYVLCIMYVCIIMYAYVYRVRPPPQIEFQFDPLMHFPHVINPLC